MGGGPKRELEIRAAVVTDRGLRRPINEDSACLVRPHDSAMIRDKGVLAVVADGLGGHAAGEVASRRAVEHVCREYYASDAPPLAALGAAMELANSRIYAESRSGSDLIGMGATCTSLVVRGAEAIWGHIGDSRLYVVGGGSIRQLTRDHTRVMELVRQGRMTTEHARARSDRHVLERALGQAERVEIDLPDAPLTIAPGDAFVLCSDGLTDVVLDEEIRLAAASGDPYRACLGLVDLAKQRDALDNISVVILLLVEGRAGPTERLEETGS